jgi:membrane protease YdiL (CAAX protease family)
MDIRAHIQRHAVVSYFALAFLVAWGGCFVAIGPKFIRGEALQFTDALLVFPLLLIGPSLAGIVMAYLVDGKSGLRDLFSRMSLWRVGARWYSAILVFPVLILAVQLGLVSILSWDFAPYFFPMGFLIGLLAGFFEEIGWTGFALPKMQLKHSALAVGIYLGVIHSVWHLAADYLASSGARGVYWLPHFAMFLVSMTAMRVLVVWVYANTRSVLLAQLMHASSTGFLSILVPLSLSPANDTIFYAVYAVILWIAVAIVVAKYGKHLVQQQPC